MIRKAIISVASITLLLTLQIAAQQKTVITIFVHGTIAPGAALCSPVAAIKYNLSPKTWYGRIIQEVRQDHRMRQDWPLLDEGMIEISPEILQQYHNQTLIPELGKYAAYQVVGAYDHFQRSSDSSSTTLYRYFFYGHNGFLDENERRKAGKDLYNNIVKIRSSFETEDDVIFNIIGHSHGGTISLYTALGEQEQHQQLHIANLILLGTPLQKGQETLISDPMFERIFNFYSLGDSIQTKDFLSTNGRKSYARLKDVLDENQEVHNRYDVELSVAGDPHALGHQTLWLLGKYNNALRLRFTNRKKIKQVFDHIDPLPIAAFCPLMIRIIPEINNDNHEKSVIDMKLNLTADSKTLKIQTNFGTERDLLGISYVIERAKKLWQPHAVCSELYKHTLIFGAALHTLFKKR